MNRKDLVKNFILSALMIMMTGCGKPSKVNAQEPVVTKQTPVKVIFDTDMCYDVDDVGALAIINAMEDNGEDTLLAVCYNEVNKYGAAAIDAINTWYGRGNTPIGIYKKTLANPDTSPYLKYLAAFPNDISSDDLSKVPSALNVYIQTLESQPDSSVTIISVGFLNNLYDLLTSRPKLIAQKVKKLVIMGAVNNDDFNLVRHNLVSESETVLKDWPTPIVISQLGGNIYTGVALQTTPTGNPVREAYYRWFHEQFKGRPSWDPMAALYAIRGQKYPYFNLVTTGTGSLPNGFVYHMKAGWRSYDTKNLTNTEFENLLNSLMTQPPKLGK